MSKAMLNVRQRRGELLARISTQRDEIAQLGARMQVPLAIADQGVAAVRFLRSQPLLIAGVAALVVLKRQGVGVLLRRGWVVWRGYRYLVSFTTKFSSRF